MFRESQRTFQNILLETRVQCCRNCLAIKKNREPAFLRHGTVRICVENLGLHTRIPNIPILCVRFQNIRKYDIATRLLLPVSTSAPLTNDNTHPIPPRQYLAFVHCHPSFLGSRRSSSSSGHDSFICSSISQKCVPIQKLSQLIYHH